MPDGRALKSSGLVEIRRRVAVSERRADEFTALVGERPLIAVCERAALVLAIAAIEGRRGLPVRRGTQ